MMKSVVATALLAAAVIAAPVDIAKTNVVKSDKESDFNALLQSEAPCNDKLVVGYSSMGDTTIFVPIVPFNTDGTDDCYKALNPTSGALYTQVDSVCFTQDGSATPVETPGGQACPIGRGDVCKKGQFCVPIDDEATSAVACNENLLFCPRSEITKHALQSSYDCGGVCPPDDWSPGWDKAWDACQDTVDDARTEAENDAYSENCSRNRVFDNLRIPKDKKGKVMLDIQPIANEAKGKKCVDITNDFFQKVKECYDKKNTGLKLSAKAELISVDAACLDQKEDELVCKSTKGCNIGCPNETECTKDETICAGRCEETATAGRKECTSAATQLVAGVVAIAALAVAFF